MATIPYSDVENRQLLPIDAQDVVTKVHLVIFGNRAGRDPGFVSVYDASALETPESVPYAAWPIVYTYEAPEHATYGCERTFDIPSIDLFLAPNDPGVPEPNRIGGFTNPGDPSAVRDGDGTTYAETTDGGFINYEDLDGAWGFRLRYTLSSGSGGAVNAFRTYGTVAHRPVVAEAHALRFGQTAMNSGNLPDVADANEVYMVVPRDARTHPVNDPVVEITAWETLIAFTAASGTSVKLYEFYPLILDEALLETIAKSNIRLPAQLPQRVTVRGYVAPDREHTITGWPGGDYTGAVAQHQYELGRTVIDFEQAGSPVGLKAEAIEAARERRVTIDRAVAEAAYPVRMGERQ